MLLVKILIIKASIGDQNKHWESKLMITKGRQLFDVTEELWREMESTGKPTYCSAYPQKIPDAIDFFVIKISLLLYRKRMVYEFSSLANYTIIKIIKKERPFELWLTNELGVFLNLLKNKNTTKYTSENC